MIVHSRQEATEYMNKKGRANKPFLFIINYKADLIHVYEPNEIDSSELLFDLNGFTNYTDCSEDKPSFEWKPEPVPFSVYDKSFRYVTDEIKAGNSYLLNLTFPTKIFTNLSLKSIFELSKARYKLWLKDEFVCFSPEVFVRINEGYIRSFPMKGTIDASLPDAANQILNDQKEMAEHATIVDLIRNDLSMIASDVSVKRYRYLDRLSTNRGDLLQVSSEIEGRLPEGWQEKIGDLLFSLLPAGSISGAPKKKTRKIIEQAELDERGFYTGITGYFDGTKLDSAVMIRFIEQKDGVFLFRSGGGITAQSDVNKEYNEIIQKVYVPIY